MMKSDISRPDPYVLISSGEQGVQDRYAPTGLRLNSALGIALQPVQSIQCRNFIDKWNVSRINPMECVPNKPE